MLNSPSISTRIRSGRARSLVASLTPTMLGNFASRGAVPERGDQSDKRPFEHGFLPASAAACCERMGRTIIPTVARYNSHRSALVALASRNWCYRALQYQLAAGDEKP